MDVHSFATSQCNRLQRQICNHPLLQRSQDSSSSHRGISLKKLSWRCKAKANSTPKQGARPETLFFMSSPYNQVQVVKFPEGCKQSGPLEGYTALFLDRSGSVHSLYNPDRAEVGNQLYWNHLALIAACVEGPIGILGLGSGTIPRIIHQHWPHQHMHGYELDKIVLDAGRQYMGLKAVEDSGALTSHVEDALSDKASIEGGFAGVIVDLFASGKVVDPLNESNPWRKIKEKVKPGGPVIANVGKGQIALNAFYNAFSDQDVYAKPSLGNWLAISGGDPIALRDSLPAVLQYTAEDWKPYRDVAQK